MPRPQPEDHAPYFDRYISLTAGDSARELIETYSKKLDDFYSNLPEDRAEFAYAPGKWTVKQVVQHLSDAERIFAYRMLRIARNDKTPLPGFDENQFAENDNSSSRSFRDVKDEFIAVRAATDALIKSLNEEMLARQAEASGKINSANSIAFTLFGHALHHKKIIEERYL